ncbi:MAG: hypothetical protein AAFP89_26110 [Bacteroidota bacterium]
MKERSFWDENNYPVYAVIQSEKLGVYFNDPLTARNTQLFSLSLTGTNGDIDRDLNQIAQQPFFYFLNGHEAQTQAKADYFDQKVAKKRDREINPHIVLELDDQPDITQEETDPKQKPALPKIDLSVLLFDLFHDIYFTQEFDHSVEINRIKSLLEKSTLCNLLLGKWRALYRKEQMNQYGDSIKERISSVYWDIPSYNYKTATASWISLLTDKDPTVGEVYKDSPWFSENLEYELKQSIHYHTDRDSHLQPHVKQALQKVHQAQPKWGVKAAEWYLSRYNLWQAFSNLNRSNKLHTYILAILFLVPLLVATQIIPDVFGRPSKALFLVLGIGGTMFLILNTRFERSEFEGLSFLGLGACISPRLVLTTSIGWLAYHEKIVTQGSGWLYGVTFVLILTITFAYMFRTLRDAASDLQNMDLIKRVGQMMSVALVYTLWTGIIITAIQYGDTYSLNPEDTEQVCSTQDFLENADVMGLCAGDFEGNKTNWLIIKLCYLLQGIPLVFFGGVFLDLLFKNKPVSGF